MVQLSQVLVFAVSIVCCASRAQVSSGGSSGRPSNCICTPFFRCFDEETSSDTFGVVDDRISIIGNRHVITLRQESEPGSCGDILDVCCTHLVQPPVVTTSTPSPQPQSTIPPNSPPTPSPHTTPTPRTTASPIAPPSPTAATPVRPIQRPKPRSGACGVRNMEGAGFTIDGFTDGQAQYGEFPWMVALLTNNIGFGSDMGATNLFVGGGSLIHPLVVLTAAHKLFDTLFDNGENSTFTVRIGEWNFRATNEPTSHQDISVTQFIYHPRFDRKKSSYNYALLILERPADLGETVGTICLPSNPGQNFDGSQCILSGWGKNIFGEEGRYQRILKSVSVNMVGYSQCQSSLRQTPRLGTSFSLHRSFVCAGDEGQDACTGDGGSPLVCPDPTSPGQYVQVGISSWGIGCGQTGIPGVYSAVAPAIEWIQEQLSIIPDFDVRLGV